MSHKRFVVIFLIVSCSFQISCVSNKKIIKTGDLCGVVVDENNEPIPNFLVKCSHSSLFSVTTFTNNSGIFVFPQMNSGVYRISGSKDNYVFLDDQEFIFRDSSSLFCCQIRSLKDVLGTIDSYIENKEFEKGVCLLEKVKIKEKGLSNGVYLSYMAYLNYMLKNFDAYTQNITKLKKIGNEKCNYFIKKMEMQNESE